MKNFDIPEVYRSSFISHIKNLRRDSDPRKKDFSPTVLDFGSVSFLVARHFGFCYGVENAIEISYKAVNENPNKRIFLLSQMIHNPNVNNDLLEKGIRFIMDTEGNMFMDWEELNSDDIVIIPAFGTTLEIEKILHDKGIETMKYNTTCPFVEKVWNMSSKLGSQDYSVIIHGKANHEETKATFSHSQSQAPSIIIKDLKEANILCDIITQKLDKNIFFTQFKGKYSEGFDPDKDLIRVGVINQTTMLATETQQIADLIKEAIIEKYGINNIHNHFADTRHTLCYATNENQQATYGLLEQKADFAIVVGGYNSSNTSHIVELCEEKLPTYFISSAHEILSQNAIQHFDFHHKTTQITKDYLPKNQKTTIILTSGASCPDRLVDEVLDKILSYFENVKSKEEVISSLSFI
jgi:4-hydroxy-3-methylbut-2-en-1-yl diphosphate reductase